MVLPGSGSHSPRFQSLTRGWASSPGVSCRSGVRTRSFSVPRWPTAACEKASAMPRKMFQSLRASHTGSIAAVSGWMNGCMSVVLRSFFSYQVAVGSTMSENRPVVFIRKSIVTMRSSLPSGALSRQVTSSGLTSPMAPRSLPSTPFLAPSRCLRKYSWPLPLAPSRFERQTNRLRGKFFGLSGSSHDMRSAPDFRPSTAKAIGSLPACRPPGRPRAGWSRAAARSAASPCARRARCSRSGCRSTSPGRRAARGSRRG